MEPKQEIYLVQEGALWSGLQVLMQNGVVQIFSQISQFNWLEPFKIEDQYENRGTGFFIDDQGYLITNFHVIDEAKKIWINIPILGKQLLHVHIVGVCPDRDLALLCLNKPDFEYVQKKLGAMPFFKLGDSDSIRRVASILILGYPLGQFSLKSSTGIIGGFELVGGRQLIQMSAPINRGNSGGPVLDIRGMVIGIATAAVHFAHNVGYAIPINDLTMILDDLRTTRLLRKPTLGGRFVGSSDEKAHFLKNPLPAGLYVSTVFTDSMLEKAGVQVGDMLYEFNGYQLDAYGDASVNWCTDKVSLYELINRIKVGDMVLLVIYRNGVRKEIQITCEFANIWPIRYVYPDFEPVSYEIIGGMIIMELRLNHLPFLIPLETDLHFYQQPEHRMKSVLVITHIFPGSYAAELRTLDAGTIIMQINGKNVSTIAQYRRALSKSLETGYVTIMTKYDVFVVFELERLLDDEERLSVNFLYPISKTIQQMRRSRLKTTNI